ncbi:MAG: addiction module antidote protein [Sphingomonadaceae bacterium]
MTFAALAVLPDFRALPSREALLASAVRLWAAAAQRGRAPCPGIAGRLGSELAARRLGLLMEMVCAAWTEPFHVGPPCSARLSHDETLLLAMIDHAAAGDRSGFERLLAEMIGADARERLYWASRRLAGAFSPPL